MRLAAAVRTPDLRHPRRQTMHFDRPRLRRELAHRATTPIPASRGNCLPVKKGLGVSNVVVDLSASRQRTSRIPNLLNPHRGSSGLGRKFAVWRTQAADRVLGIVVDDMSCQTPESEDLPAPRLVPTSLAKRTIYDTRLP